MACCGSGDAAPTKYELVTPANPEPRIFLSLTEAEIQRSRDGGGTIRRVT